jgi:hypothetical protein
MPPKRKDHNSTSAASVSGPKPKRSKPSFRTPTLAAQVSDSASQPSSSNNRVVTLQTGASGRRGYRTQELPAASSSSISVPPNIANDAVEAYEHTSSGEHDITAPEIQNNIPAASESKARTKQKNTTTVRL